VLDVLDLDDPEMAQARDASAVERLVDAARESGFIRGLRAPATGDLVGPALSLADLKELVAELGRS